MAISKATRVFESPLLCIRPFECSVHIFRGPCASLADASLADASLAQKILDGLYCKFLPLKLVTRWNQSLNTFSHSQHIIAPSQIQISQLIQVTKLKYSFSSYWMTSPEIKNFQLLFWAVWNSIKLIMANYQLILHTLFIKCLWLRPSAYSFG